MIVWLLFFQFIAPADHEKLWIAGAVVVVNTDEMRRRFGELGNFDGDFVFVCFGLENDVGWFAPEFRRPRIEFSRKREDVRRAATGADGMDRFEFERFAARGNQTDERGWQPKPPHHTNSSL